MRLLVISCRKKSAQYLSILEKQEIDFDLLCEISLLNQLPYSSREYSGALLEQSTLSDARQGEESLLELIKNIYPTLDTHSGPRSLRDCSEESELESFIARCSQFSPRTIRRQDRVKVSLPALVFAGKIFSRPQQVTTFDLSKSGCYLPLSNPLRLSVGDKLWLSVADLVDSNPILSEVRWISDEQQFDRLPGVGLRFLELEASQIEGLQVLVLEGMISPGRRSQSSG